MSDIRQSILAEFPIKTKCSCDGEKKYRYLWEAQIINQSGNGKPVTFLMLNPSCADEILTDPTIDKCLTYVAQWGYSSLRVVNLFAYRTSEPEDLCNVLDPVGLHNNRAILHAILDAPLTICAWGNGEKASQLLKKRVKDVCKLLKPHRERLNLKCFGFTQLCEPTHPRNRKLLHKEVALCELECYDPWSPA